VSLLLALACGSAPERPPRALRRADATPRSDTAPRPPGCPAQAAASPLLPGVTAEHRSAAYWLARAADADEVLMSPQEIATLNRALAGAPEELRGQRDLRQPVVAAEIAAQVAARLSWLRERFERGEFLAARPDVAQWLALPDPLPEVRPELRVTLAPVQFFCAPSAEPFRAAEGRSDRNHCSLARPQELVQLLAPWPGGLVLARTSYTWGWVRAGGPWSPPLPAPLIDAYASGPFAMVAPAAVPALAAAGGDRVRLPLAPQRADAVLVASAAGFATVAAAPAALSPVPRPLTRRAVLEQAFRHLDATYGWGGEGGGHDCSSLLMDLFASFGLALPRHSGRQAQAGTYRLDVSAASESERLAVLDAAQESGIVLLEFPGHIMLYLGRDHRDRPMVLHAFADYLSPCPGGGETVHVVDRVQVSDLELGRGSSRRAFIERLRHITVFGKGPPAALAGAAVQRPPVQPVRPSARSCRRAGSERLWISPAQVVRARPVRAVAALARDPGPVALLFFDPLGRVHAPANLRLGGPPHGYVAEAVAATPGWWTAVLGDGDRIEACRRFEVLRQAPAQPPAGPVGSNGPVAVPPAMRSAGPAAALAVEQGGPAAPGRSEASRPPGHDTGPGMVTTQPLTPTAGGAGPEAAAGAATAAPAGVPAWPVERRWSAALEDLYAVFVERLFDHPDDEELTWPDLHTLLRDRPHNLLHDHRAVGEDAALVLQPDCADLPYTLRAYFAWKLGLPFGYHECQRARPGRPPTCVLAATNLSPVPARLDGRAARLPFQDFVDLGLRRAVHSSSGRTHPDDDQTDLYPVALSRAALRPGTVFTDPYGHLLIIARWVAQAPGRPGILIGADAQPDGTIGRRRFWRGSFVFHPDTASGGAGFKAFRPWAWDPASQKVTSVPRAELGKRPWREIVAPFGDEQYRGDTHAFYDRMEALINPRPLDPEAAQQALIEALAEAVARRSQSIDNGERFMRSRRDQPIEMPVGERIFLTTGPWEDFATPSRDWRLLVSIDTVLDSPRAVLRAPQQYGVAAADAAAVSARLERRLTAALAARSFAYTRSDGSRFPLPLQDVIARRERFEVAYNPNDCVELRWGAAEQSAEAATCRRRAPPGQRAQMETVRPWFRERRRPAN
jgi:hypothetical protein